MLPVAVLVSAASLWFYLTAQPAPVPPELSDLGGRPEAMRALLARYYERARSNPRSADAHGLYGKALQANHLYSRARLAYDIAERLDPDDFRWFYYRALIAEERERQDELLTLLQASLDRDPRYTPAVLKLAELHLRRGDLSHAEESFQRALELADGDTVVRLHGAIGLARIERARGDWKAMMKRLETHARDHRHIRQVCQLREEALRRMRHPDAAAERDRLASDGNLARTPSVNDALAEKLVDLCCSATELMRLANLAELEGDVQRTVRLARRAVEVEPEDADAHHFLSYVLVKHLGVNPEIVSEALEHRDRGLALRPGYVDLLGKLAEAFRDRQRVDLAIEQVRRYLAVRPRAADMNLNLGTLLLLQRRFEEAIPYLTVAASEDPASDRARNNLASALMTLGKLEQALPYVEEAVRLNPLNQQAQLNLGTVLVRLDRRSEALPYLAQAVSLNPQDGQARFRLGDTLARLNRAREALPHLYEAVRLHPTFAVVHESLGNALNQVGRVEEGAEHVRKAARLSGAR